MLASTWYFSAFCLIYKIAAKVSSIGLGNSNSPIVYSKTKAAISCPKKAKAIGSASLWEVNSYPPPGIIKIAFLFLPVENSSKLSGQ